MEPNLIDISFERLGLSDSISFWQAGARSAQGTGFCEVFFLAHSQCLNIEIILIFLFLQIL